jgi:hypothetical protein
MRPTLAPADLHRDVPDARREALAGWCREAVMRTAQGIATMIAASAMRAQGRCIFTLRSV